MLRSPRLNSTVWWVGYLAALVAVTLVSVLIGVVLARLHLANIAMLYLIAVLGTAALFGSGPAVLASVAAFLTFNFLFIDPQHTLTVSDPEEWDALLLVLVCALVAGQLAAALRHRAEESRRKEREAASLYEDRLRLER